LYRYSTAGAFPVEAVRVMSKICREAEVGRCRLNQVDS
jgi:pyruvate kinase